MKIKNKKSRKFYTKRHQSKKKINSGKAKNKEWKCW